MNKIIQKKKWAFEFIKELQSFYIQEKKLIYIDESSVKLNFNEEFL